MHALKLLLALPAITAAFSFHHPPLPLARTSLQSRLLSTPYLMHDFEDESTYRYLLSKARECAYSPNTHPAEAKRFLRDILELEAGCVSGDLTGDVCENVDEVAEIVARLREKVNSNMIIGPSDVSAAETMAVLVISSLSFALLAEFLRWQQHAVPFTMQEWMWAYQGGYLDDMISHYLRNGGL